MGVISCSLQRLKLVSCSDKSASCKLMATKMQTCCSKKLWHTPLSPPPFGIPTALKTFLTLLQQPEMLQSQKQFSNVCEKACLVCQTMQPFGKHAASGKLCLTLSKLPHQLGPVFQKACNSNADDSSVSKKLPSVCKKGLLVWL